MWYFFGSAEKYHMIMTIILADLISIDQAGDRDQTMAHI